MPVDCTMDRYNTINPADKDSAASDTTVEQPQQPQAVFEQHLGEVRQLGPIYSHSDLYDITEEDDRLIQAASGAALDRGPPPNATTIEIYDRRLRKLAEALKQSGQSIAELDDDTLLDRSKKLLPKDKVIAPALSMVSRYREPSDTAPAPTTHYRPSKEDASLIRKASEAGFGRALDAKTAGNYASSLRKLAAALRPLSIAKLTHKALLGHAHALFPKDKKLTYALNRLSDYRRIAGQDNSAADGGNSRPPIQPTADLPVQLFYHEQPLGNAADKGGSLPADPFKATQVWEGTGLTLHSPAQRVAQDVLFDAVRRSEVPPRASFDAPVLWRGMRAAAPSPVQSFAQEALFDAADRESLLPATSLDAPVLWPTTSSVTHSPVQSVAQEELFDAAHRERLLPAAPFNAPVLWPTISSVAHPPVQSVVHEGVFDAAHRERVPATSFDAPVLWPTTSSVTHSPLQSVAQEELFDAANGDGSAPTVDLDASKLWTAMGSPPQSVRRADPFDVVIWQPSSRSQNPASQEDFGRMMHQDGAPPATHDMVPAAAGESFDASLAVPEDFSHGTQAAPDMMRSRLSRWGLLPDAAQRVKTYDIRGERYTAVLGPRGRDDVQLIHLRSPAIGDTFDVSFAVSKDFSHGTQSAPEILISTLGKWDFLPNGEHPVMNYEIAGDRYTAVLGPRGSNDVQLIHHPRLALPGEAALVTSTAPPHAHLAPGFNPLSSFELRKDPPLAVAPNIPLPSAAPRSGHQPFPQVPELGELLGDDWRHGPQEASPVVIDMLQNLGLLPSQEVPMTRFLIHSQPYTAESLPGGRVLLFHRPQFS